LKELIREAVLQALIEAAQKHNAPAETPRYYDVEAAAVYIVHQLPFILI
jgi:hypothetical protein